MLATVEATQGRKLVGWSLVGWVLGPLTCCLSCAWFSAWSTGAGKQSTTSELFDSVQVIAGPEELWLFLEVDRLVCRPGAFVDPPIVSVGHRQIVVIVSADGAAKRIVVGHANGVSFHENLGRVFRHRDGIYLYQGRSMNTRESVFVWTIDRFQLMSIADGDDLLRQNGLADLHPARVHAAFDGLTLGSGWQPLLAKSGLYTWDESKRRIVHLPEGDLTWGGRAYAWDEVKPSDGQIAVELRPELGSAIPLLEYDPRSVPLSADGPQALWSGPHQRGHQR